MGNVVSKTSDTIESCLTLIYYKLFKLSTPSGIQATYYCKKTFLVHIGKASERRFKERA